MEPYELRQLSFQYSFPFLFFELLQFGTNELLQDSPSFPNLFNRVKEINLFSISRLYLEAFSEKGSTQSEFANYMVEKIDVNDYIQIQFSDLIGAYQFIPERYDLVNITPYWRTTPQYIEPRIMHQFIQATLEFHISKTSEIFRFVNPILPEKYGLCRIWEKLQHFICVDREKQTVQLITSGFD